MFLIKRPDGQMINFDAAEFAEHHGYDLKITLSGNQIVYIRQLSLADILHEKRREQYWMKAEWQTDAEVRMNTAAPRI